MGLITGIHTSTIGLRIRPCAAVRGDSFRARQMNPEVRWILSIALMASLTGRQDGQPRKSSGAVCSTARVAGKKAWCCSSGFKSCPSDAAAAGAGYGAGTKHGADFNGAPIAEIHDIPFGIAEAR